MVQLAVCLSGDKHEQMHVFCYCFLIVLREQIHGNNISSAADYGISLHHPCGSSLNSPVHTECYLEQRF